MLILTIITALCIIVCTICYVCCKTQDNKNIFFILSMLFGIGFGMCLVESDHKNKPTAMDVYHGNTSLEIKQQIKNGVILKSDTIVVFK